MTSLHLTAGLRAVWPSPAVPAPELVAYDRSPGQHRSGCRGSLILVDFGLGHTGPVSTCSSSPNRAISDRSQIRRSQPRGWGGERTELTVVGVAVIKSTYHTDSTHVLDGYS